MSFTPTEVELKLIFELPEAVSATSTDPDSVVITFWADDLFKAENGQTLPRGLTISAPIYRQVSTEVGKDYRKFGQIVGYITLGFLILGFAWSYNV